MKYALIQVSNGSFTVVAEYGDNKQAGFVGWHDRCKILWNAPDVIKATVALVDENLDVVEGMIEQISHEEEPEITE